MTMRVNLLKAAFFIAVLHFSNGLRFQCRSSETCKSLGDCVDSVKEYETRIFVTCSSDDEEVKVCCPPPDKLTRAMVLAHRNLPLVNSDVCGQTSESDRITNGNDASIGQFPWMALLKFKDHKTGKDIFSCGGAVINNRYVLTAAHCFKIQQQTLKTVVLGELDLSTDPDCEEFCADPVLEMNIEKKIGHEKYDQPLRKNDIGLIRVTAEIPFTDYIRPICLPYHTAVPDGTTVRYVIAGWGKKDHHDVVGSNVLQFSRVYITPIVECDPFHTADVRPLSKVTQMCAGGLGPDACNGDSGGPLMALYNDETPTQLTGIISFRTGSECGPTPSVYTNVESYFDWILENIEP